MLIDDFYKIISSKRIEKNTIRAKIQLNPEHKVYSGHFPGNPVTPGVISVQIITEILEDYFKKKLILRKAGNIKFTSVIIPAKVKELTIEISYSFTEENTVKSKSIIKNSDKVFLKMQSVYEILV